jgi:hypothetical protein
MFPWYLFHHTRSPTVFGECGQYFLLHVYLVFLITHPTMHRALFYRTFLTFPKPYLLSVVVCIKFLHTTFSQVFSTIPKQYICSSIFIGRMNVALPSCVMLLYQRDSFYLLIQLWFAVMRAIKAVCLYMGLLSCIPPAADLGSLLCLYYNTYLVKNAFCTSA